VAQPPLLRQAGDWARFNRSATALAKAGVFLRLNIFAMSTPDLILVPGLLCDDAVWEHQTRSLQTIANISIADHKSLNSFQTMADAILQHAPPRFALAGHSMGGRVAFQILRQAPERVTRLALLDTASTPKRDGIEGEREAAERYALLEIAQKEGMREMGRNWVQRMVHPDRLSDPDLIDAILDMIARKTPEIFAGQIRALLNRPDATDLLREIRCPTMVLCGRQDSWSVLEHHEQMASMIPDSRLVVIENCGHMSTMERPAEVTAALREWLISLPA
jgi:pimeloyl-ACP methyl ester carboxylesterase